MVPPWLRAAVVAAVTGLSLPAFAQDGPPGAVPCVDCLSVRVGPPVVVRGPFPDELDAPFTAVRLPDGGMRGFSANGTTYAIEGATIWDMAGARRPVLTAGPAGSPSNCGQWLTSVVRSGEGLIGFVHQERNCDYARGRTEKSMGIALSDDDGLTWTPTETVITGRDLAVTDRTTGEGDCTMVDGRDSYLYAYCQRNSDWQTIVLRAPLGAPSEWVKYFEGDWSEPGLGGNATAMGFFGPGAGYFLEQGWIGAVATDPWFGGLRLALSQDKVTFVDLKEPLVPIDGAEWDRPARTDLLAYSAIANPDDGSNGVNDRFVLSSILVPAGKGFESRYQVHRTVSISVRDEPVAVQVGLALTRWSDPARGGYVTSTGPLTGERAGFRRDAIVGHMLTRAPDGVPSTKLAECSRVADGAILQMLAEDGNCASGFERDRTAGWLFATEQAGTLPVYACLNPDRQVQFASAQPDCEGLGQVQSLLGYGLAP